MKRNNFLILLLVILVVAYFTTGLENQSAEEVHILAGVGMDVQENISKNMIYKVHRSIYVFHEDNTTSSEVLTGSATGFGGTRQEMHKKSNKRDITGQEKVFLISDNLAENGLKPILNFIFRNPMANNSAFFTVCKGDSLKILKYNVPGYPSSLDYIEGMIRNAKDYNFFSDNYDAMNIYVRVDAEGRNVVLPYIELKEDPSTPEKRELQITGTAFFNKDKMVAKLNMEDTQTMNLLRENNVKGILKIQNEPKKFTEFYATSKRKVTCSKTGDKYNFIINLELKGDIYSNELYKNLISDATQKKRFEEDLAQNIEYRCNSFLDKMKYTYKADFLELGKVAASKYGRKTGANWNDIVQNSNIKVNVKVKVDKQGRGDY